MDRKRYRKCHSSEMEDPKETKPFESVVSDLGSKHLFTFAVPSDLQLML